MRSGHHIEVRGVWLSLAIAACSPERRPPVARYPAQPAARCPSPTPDPTPALAATPESEATTRRTADLAALRTELTTVVSELDAIDVEISTSAADLSVSAARANAIDQGVLVEKLQIDGLPPRAPLQLRRIADAYYRVRVKSLELAKELGPKHPDMVAVDDELAWLRQRFYDQRDAETTWLDNLRGEFARVSPTAPNGVALARARALLRTIPMIKYTELAATDVPAAIRIAVDRELDASRQLDLQAHDLGPKHPTMLRLLAEHDAAGNALRDALTEATTLANATLTGPATKPRPYDPATMQRRIELAERARQLRLEIDERERR